MAKATTAPKGRLSKTVSENGSSRTIKPEQGTSKAYLLDRLERDFRSGAPMIRKGQAYGSAPAARGGLLHRFILGLFGAVVV